MAVKHYQIRLVKEIENDGTLKTFRELGHPCERQGQKTLKGCGTRNEAVKHALECSSNLPAGAKGIVIVEFQAGGARISAGKVVKPYVGANPRKTDTTNWFLFIDRQGKRHEVVEGSHKIHR
jgi:hypothetical protein